MTAIAGVRSQPCTYYMGATGGGVWKTENCGTDWTPICDGQIATGSIGSIDVSESNPNVVWVGTGSAAIRSNVIIGRGVYKSIDAGRTWQFMGLKDAGQIGAIVIHPTNPDVVWLAALGSPFGPNDERGIFKTTDGGKTWKKTLFVNEETGGRVVAVNYANPERALCRHVPRLPQRLGHHQRRPGERRRHLQVDGRRRDVDEAVERPAVHADRQDRHRHRAQSTGDRLRDGRGAGQPRAGCTSRAMPVRRGSS